MTPLVILASIVICKLLLIVAMVYTAILVFKDDAKQEQPPEQPPEPRKHPRRWTSYSTKH